MRAKELPAPPALLVFKFGKWWEFQEELFLTCVVNLKCVGHFGRCMRPYTNFWRGIIIDELIRREWLTERMALTKKGDEVVIKNLHLCEY